MRRSSAHDLLADARRRLVAAGVPAAPREARLLLGWVLGISEAGLLAHPEIEVGAADRERFAGFVERRIAGEPVAYLFGIKEFFGRPFAVDARVLVPRPETEHLVEMALELDLPERPRLLDIGTGSGCLAITLALEIPGARVVAVDISPGALAVARRNARRLDARVALLGGDLTTALRLGGFDLVVSNPPYIDRDDPAAVEIQVDAHEPHAALYADDRGRAVIRRLLDAAIEMRPGAALLLEIGFDQSAWLADAVDRRPGLRLVEMREDHAGIPRSARILRTGD